MNTSSKNIRSVTIPESVIRIGKGAFCECENLEEIVFPEKSRLTIIDEFAFLKCEKLMHFHFSETVSEIRKYAFYECTHLKEAILPKYVSISNYAFRLCKSLQYLQIPDGVEIIKEGAFFGCQNLRTVSIPDSVSEIERKAFQYCEKLEELRLLLNLKKLEHLHLIFPSHVYMY